MIRHIQDYKNDLIKFYCVKKAIKENPQGSMFEIGSRKEFSNICDWYEENFEGRFFRRINPNNQFLAFFALGFAGNQGPHE